jgi:hypothetical protein
MDLRERAVARITAGESVRSVAALLERDDFQRNRHRALSFCSSMILSKNRAPLFKIML